MTKPRVSTHKELVAELEKDPEYRKVDRQQKPYYDILLEVIKRRNELGLTQEELAKRANTHQSCISRVESAEHDIQLSTLIEIAEALGTRVEIKLVPIYYVEDKDYRDLLRVESVISEAGTIPYEAAPEDTALGRSIITYQSSKWEEQRPY